MKTLPFAGYLPLVLLLAILTFTLPGQAQPCLDYGDYIHHTFHSPPSTAEYDKYCRQIIHQGGWVHTIVHVDTGDPGIPVADEVIAIDVGGVAAPLPVTAYASSSTGFYCFDVRGDGAAFATTFAPNPPPDPHYFASYDISDPADWSSLDFVYQSLFDPWRELDVGSLGGYAVDDHPRLYVFNAANPASMSLVANYDLPQVAKKVLLSDDESHLFVLGSNRLYIYSLASWFYPIQISSIFISASTTDMLQVGTGLLLAGVDKVHRYDISDPSAPSFDWIVYMDDVEDISAIAVSGNTLFAAGPDGPLEARDITDFHNSQHLVSLPLTSSDMNPPALDAHGSQVYATFSDRGYLGYEMAGFEQAEPAAVFPLARNTVAMAAGGPDWFVAIGYGRFRVMDVQNALAPAEIGLIPCNYTLPTDVWTDGTHAYATTQNGDFLAYSVADRENPELIGTCGALPGRALDVYGDYAFAAAGNLGLKVVSVSNPANPQIVATVPGWYEETTGVAVKGSGTYVAFVVQQNVTSPGPCGMAVVDIHTPWSPMVFDIVEVPLSSHATLVGSHVLLHGEGQLTVVDVSNAFFPVVESTIGLPGPGTNLAYADGRLYLTDGDGGMQVVQWSPGDVPRLAGHLPLTDAAEDVAVLGDYVYLVTQPAGVTVAYKDCTGASPVADPVPPAATRLFQNEPNPFNPSTTISYELEQPAAVWLEVFDLAGRRVAVLRRGATELGGRHSVLWDGRDDAGRALPSGLYVYCLQAGEHCQMRKMALIR